MYLGHVFIKISKMKKLYYTFLVLFTFSFQNVFAQFPNCNGADSNKVFIHTGSSIEVYDPAFPVSPSNPSTFMASMPSSGGLTISRNLNGNLAASPTFYSNIGGTYQYYNGVGWTNTGHSVPTVNPGGGINFIYSLDGGNGAVNKYDGTGAAVALTTITPSSGPYDLEADNLDNFYHMEANTSPGRIIKYSPAGVPIDTFIMNGNPIQTAGGGFAMIGNEVYAVFNTTPSFYHGTIVNHVVNIQPIGQISASDLATCPHIPAGVPPTPPIADFLISNYTICAGTCVQFIDSSKNNPSAWLWSFPGGNPASSFLQNPGTVCFDTAGVYTIQLIVSNAGGADTTTRILTVLPVPIASIKGDTSICEGQSITLTASPSGMNYTWSNGSTQQSITETPSITTTYSVVVSQNICSDTASILVNVWPFQKGAIMDDTLVCNGTPVELWVSGGTGQYQWYPVQGLSCEFCPNPVASGQGTGTYHAILLDNHGCQDTLTVRIEIQPPFNLILHNHDTTIYLGDNVQLMASGAPFYYWTPSQYLTYSQSNSPLATPLEDITYTVTGVSLLQGCPQSASVHIKVIQPDVILPNAFTPNGDGNNDVFRVVGRKFINLQEFKIFNRLGNELFSTSDIREGWDGTYKGVPQDPGVYFYQIRVAYPNGKTQFFKGDITLIR